MIRDIKIKDVYKDETGKILLREPIYPSETWVVIANERDKGIVNDNNIYYYVEDKIDLRKLKAGQFIMLDEYFEVMEVYKL